MDLDAIITFKQVLIKDEITKVDIMMLSSAINNYNIDINFSLRENLILMSHDVSLNELLGYLKEFTGSDDSYLNIPIYKLLLQKDELRFLLINAHKKNMLKEDSLLDIFVLIVNYIELNGYNKELMEFFKILLDYRRPVVYGLFQDNHSLNDFAFYHLSELLNNSKEDLKPILISLYSQGYIRFNKMHDYFKDFNSNFRILIETMLKKHFFSNLKMIINEQTVDEDLLNIVKEELEEFKTNNNNIKNEKFINDLYGIINRVQESIDNNRVLDRH